MGILYEKLHFIHILFKTEDLFLGGITVFIASSFAYGGLPQSNYIRLFVAILFCVLGLASINTLNQIFDVDMDSINKPERAIPSKKLTKNQVFYISFSLSLGAGLLTLYLGLIYFLIALCGLIIGIIYSSPQIHARKNPLIGNMLIGSGYGILMFFVGWNVYQPFISIPLWIPSFLLFHEIILSIGKDFPDVKGDSIKNIKTIPVIFGKKKGAIISYFMYLIPFFALIILQLRKIINLNFYPVFFLGIILGIIVFSLCGLTKTKFNLYGYYFSIVVSILIKISLLYTYLEFNPISLT